MFGFIFSLIASKSEIRDIKYNRAWRNRPPDNGLVLARGWRVGSGIEENCFFAVNSSDAHSDSEVRSIRKAHSIFRVESMISIANILLWIVNELMADFVVAVDALDSFHWRTSALGLLGS